MDSDSRSSVLLQHSSPPHTLSPLGNLQNVPPNLPSLIDTTSTAEPQQTALPAEQHPPSTMEEPPPIETHLTGDAEGGTAVEEDAASREASNTDGGSIPVTPDPSAPIDEGPTDPSANSMLPVQSIEGTTPQIPSTPDLPDVQDDAVIVEPGLNPSNPDPPPNSPPIVEEPKVEVPEWVTYEEDTSEITEEELKELEGSDGDVSALDLPHFEQKIYVGVDDPEQRPTKKMRLSWTIKGVRGTKERPNYARVMNSPAACVDGFYWYIKFFPRGNNSSHLSAYIKCSPEPPEPDSNVPENNFKVFQGPPDANLNEIEPIVELSIPATPLAKESSSSTETKDATEVDSKTPADNSLIDTTTASAIESANKDPVAHGREADWRISAEFGVVIYNPAEPRTNCFIRSEHQFNKHNEDWGWTSFHRPWNTIHVRDKFQRKPLLQNDMLTIDAYIQIYDDPTKALWWHTADEREKEWDAKLLTGYYPFGTPLLFHSPGVAGLSALLLLKPFRDIIQRVDTGRWKRDAQAKPQPLITQLQIVLFLMRYQKGEQYVDLNSILKTLDLHGETFSTVREFWEVLRRSIELEIQNDVDLLAELADIFDGAPGPMSSPITLTQPLQIPVEHVEDIQTGIKKAMTALEGNWTFPKFLTIDLDRQTFDVATREWKLLHHRVKLNETIDLSGFFIEKIPSNYTLYGFAAHVGERASGRAYTVLRPDGPGTKWLAFEDGNGNKIFSYTKKRVQDFEGLEGDALSTFRSTRQTAYVAMYIRTDCLKTFLPGGLEPYDEPNLDWFKPQLASDGVKFIGEVKPKRSNVASEVKSVMSVYVYEAATIKGRKGLLDMYNLRDPSQCAHHLTLPATTTYRQLRRMIASLLKIEQVDSIRLWNLEYGALGEFTMATMPRSPLTYALPGRKPKEYKPICLWLEVLQTDEDIKLYGIKDPPQFERSKLDQTKIDQTGLFAVDLGAPEALSGDNDDALGLLFSEIPDESPEDMAVNIPLTQPTPEADSPNETDAHLDEVQNSVFDAVNATLANLPTISDISGASLLTPDIVSATGNQLEAENSSSSQAAPAAADPVVAPVEPDHLVEVLDIEGQSRAEAAFILDDESAATIAAIIAAEIEAADQTVESTEPVTSMETPVENATDSTTPADEPPSTLSDAYTPVTSSDSTMEPAQTEEPIPLQQLPIMHVYGFIQLFDVEQQDFVVHSTFFAPLTADVRETVRKSLGYGDDHEFNVWKRVSSSVTSNVSKGATFEKIGYLDGADIIVGEPISEQTKEKLLEEGKFVTPASLSSYLWMKQRQHPFNAFTGTKTHNPFGGDSYCGPWVKGRFHGEHGTYTTSTGHTYVGPFVSGMRQGKSATVTYQNGDSYTGGFLADEKHGQGTFIQRRTGNKYTGGYQNDKRWGKGTMEYQVADEEGEMCQICYSEEMDALFYDCGHICACVECAKQVESCPICRKTVKDVVRVFRA